MVMYRKTNKMKDYLILSEGGKEVKGLKPEAMSIENIIIPEGVERIDNTAFEGNTSLKSVSLPESLAFIGSGAFAGCTSLRAIHLPHGITVLSSGVFAECSALMDIVLPAGLKVLEDACFYGCSALESLVLPESVEVIEEDAFHGCTHLKSLNIPMGARLEEIHHFVECEALTDLRISPEHPQYNAEQGFFTNLEGTAIIASWPNGVGLLCSIPEGITTIEEGAFMGCKMESIDLPSSLTEIGAWAFVGCKQLRSVVLPNHVEIIMNGAFENCTSLTEVIISENTHEIHDSAFRGCSSLQRVSAPSETVIDVEDEAFAQCAKLSQLDNLAIGDVGCYAFEDCKSLTSINNMMGGTIGTQAFAGCKSIRSITIITDCFMNFEFDGEDDLYFKGVDLKQCDLYVEEGIFEDCVEDPIFGQFGRIESETRRWDNVASVWEDLTTGEVHPIECNDYIHPHEDWPDYLLYSMDGRKVRGVRPCYDLSDYPEIIIPEGIEIIRYCAFEWDPGLKNVRLPDSLRVIEAGAFAHCSNLSQINLPCGLTRLGSGAFDCCPALKQISLSVSSIEDLQIEDSVFDWNTFEECDLNVDPSAIEKCKEHPVFGKFRNIVANTDVDPIDNIKTWLEESGLIGGNDDILFGSSYPEDESLPF